jgi:CubicO group peptidase (beta-lactamase class C family)
MPVDKKRRVVSTFWNFALIGSLSLVVGCTSSTNILDKYTAKKCQPGAGDEQFLAIPKTHSALDTPAIRQETGWTTAKLAPHEEKIDDIIHTVLDHGHIPGGAIAIVSEGQIEFAKGYGLARLDTFEQVELNTRFWIGSVSKQFTAMAVMVLVEQGVVGLDNKLSEYLPRLPASYSAVTIRHLLTHSSGIERTFVRRSCVPFSWEQLTGNTLFDALRDADLAFEPGSAQKYSNTGYSLLGMLIEAVSGKPYKDFLKDHIFDPLGMNATQSVEPKDVNLPRLSGGYEWQESKKRYRTFRPAIAFGSGAIISTVIDMAKWDAALYTDTLVSQATLKQIWTPYVLEDQKPAKSGYGFGWVIKDKSGSISVGHNGHYGGRSAYIIRHLSKKLTLVVFTNGEYVDRAEKIAQTTARYYFQHIQAAN